MNDLETSRHKWGGKGKAQKPRKKTKTRGNENKKLPSIKKVRDVAVTYTKPKCQRCGAQIIGSTPKKGLCYYCAETEYLWKPIDKLINEASDGSRLCRVNHEHGDFYDELLYEEQEFGVIRPYFQTA